MHVTTRWNEQQLNLSAAQFGAFSCDFCKWIIGEWPKSDDSVSVMLVGSIPVTTLEQFYWISHVAS